MKHVKYKEILLELTNAVANAPSEDIDAIIGKKVKEYGLSPNSENQIVRAIELIGKTAETAKELQIAKENGITRKEFIEKRMEALLEKHSENECKIILDSIEQATKNTDN